MDYPLVSIIIPLYNQGRFIQETLESVFSQSYTNWEVIVVDDDSTDDGGAIVKSMAQNDKRILYFHQQNSGPSVARNEGISRSKGKYILPLDGDDKIGERYLEKAVEYLESNDDCKLVYCRAEKFGEDTGIWTLPDYQYDKLLWENMIFCTAMYRRSDYDKTDGYNPNMVLGLEDWDFWLSLLKPEDKVHRIDDVLFYYRIKNVSRTTEVNKKYSEATKQIYKNHSSLYENYVIDIISLHNTLQCKQTEINRIISGKTYKVGRCVLAPYRLIKTILKK